MTPMTEAFVRNIEQFVDDEGIDLVAFKKGQRKDDVTQKYVRKFTQRRGALCRQGPGEGAGHAHGAALQSGHRRNLSVDRGIDRHGQPLLFLLCR